LSIELAARPRRRCQTNDFKLQVWVRCQFSWFHTLPRVPISDPWQTEPTSLTPKKVVHLGSRPRSRKPVRRWA